MAVIKIINPSHPSKLAKEMGKGGIENDGIERYISEFEVDGERCRIIQDYSTGEIVIWFEEGALVHLLRTLLSLSPYLGNSIITGVLPGKEITGEAFVLVPGGKVSIAHAANGLWIGWDGQDWIFSATLQGIAELIDIVGDER